MGAEKQERKRWICRAQTMFREWGDEGALIRNGHSAAATINSTRKVDEESLCAAGDVIG
jgi:hypothetical protein